MFGEYIVAHAYGLRGLRLKAPNAVTLWTVRGVRRDEP
jgi:hypothetical protein